MVSTASKPFQVLQRLAHISFWTLIVVIPFRYRIILQARPVGTIYSDFTDFLIFASDIALALTLPLWIAGKALNKEPLKRGPFFVTIPLIAFTFMSGLSVIDSVDPLLSASHVVRLACWQG